MQERLVVLDVEATCWDDGEQTPIEIHEVIEIGCVLTDLAGVIFDEFQTFVRPTERPELSPFCMALTHISQADVDSAPVFGDAMLLLDDWFDGRAQYWSSWGNYDHKQLSCETQRKQAVSEFLRTPHLNLKRAWRLSSKQRRNNGLDGALKFLGMTFNGVPHRAIADARNTARILPHISVDRIEQLKSEVVPDPTSVS